MLEKTFSVLSYLRKPKFYQEGDPSQVYLRVTVDGVAVEISAKRTWHPERWNNRSGRAIGVKDDVRSLNRFLDIMTNKVHDARRFLIDSVGADREASQPDSNFIKPFGRTVRNPAAAARLGSKWLIRLYLIAILVGCFSAIMTLMFLWIKLH